MEHLINFAQNFEMHLEDFVSQYGILFYLIAFLIVWAETGLIILAAFLPGETLLFAAGAVAAMPNSELHIIFLIFVFFVAAILGDTTNYFIGRYIGKWLLKTKFGNTVIPTRRLEETKKFYDKYGASTVILGRYIPIVRSFVPFVAAISKYTYLHFLKYSVIGTAGWVVLITMIGYLFGNIKFVRENFMVVILGIILFSLLPVIINAYRERKKRN